jgi:hypothetical protein
MIPFSGFQILVLRKLQTIYDLIISNPPGSTIWGSITGTLSNQTDLQNALDAKFDDPTGTISEYLRGDGSVATFPTGPTGTAGGDLSGTYPNPTVDGLQGNPVSNATPATGQTLQWNGTTWIPGTVPTGGSGGGGVFYYFNYQNTTGISPTTGLPTSPVSPSQLGITYSVGSGSITSADLIQGSYSLVCGFVTIVGTPGITDIPAGLWDFNIWADILGATGGTNQTQLQIRVFKYDSTAGTYTSLATSDAIYIYDPTVIAQYIGNVTMPQTTILATDRIYIEFWAQKNVNQIRQIQIYFDSTHPSHVHTTIPSVAGTGIVKVVNGVFQSPASTIVDADVSATAAIAVSKLSMATSRLLGRTTAGTGAVEEISLTTTGTSGAATLVGSTLNIPQYSGGSSQTLLQKAALGYEYYNDFLSTPTLSGTSDGAGYIFFFSGTSASVVASTAPGIRASNQHGFIRPTTGILATGYAGLYGGSGGNQFLLGGGIMTFTTSVLFNTLSTPTERYRVTIGYGDQATSAAEVNGIFFTYDEGGTANGTTASPNWQCVTTKGSVRTLTTTSVAINNSAWCKLSIEINAAGTSVVFYINNILVATHTTNIPSGAAELITPRVNISKTIGTISRFFHMDYLYYAQTYTTVKPV